MGSGYVQKFLRYGVGPLSILATLAMGWTSEFMSRSGENDLAQVRPRVSVVEASRVDPAYDGKLVYVSGAITAAPIVDGDSGLTFSALRLSRQVHVLQWGKSKWRRFFRAKLS